MTTFSCKGCVPPQRYPGCHSKCPKYLEEKAKHDALKAEYDRKRAIDSGIMSQISDGVHKTIKHRRKGKWYGGDY
jgi:hypothetical protein